MSLFIVFNFLDINAYFRMWSKSDNFEQYYSSHRDYFLKIHFSQFKMIFTIKPTIFQYLIKSKTLEKNFYSTVTNFQTLFKSNSNFYSEMFHKTRHIGNFTRFFYKTILLH